MIPDTLPAPARKHTLEPYVCLRCGQDTPGTLRVALWEEEEKGRLGARHASLCAVCHDAFFAGLVSRVELARYYHEAKGIQPHGWIARIERDLLLDITCLECGVLLPIAPQMEPEAISPAAEARSPDLAVECPICHTTNRLRLRAGRLTTAEILA